MSNYILDILLVLVLIIGAGTEFFVFSEESLLALVFILFILFAYIYLRDSVSQGLSAKAVSLEQTLSEVVVASTEAINDNLLLQKESLKLKASLLKPIYLLDKGDVFDKSLLVNSTNNDLMAFSLVSV
jgi:hypothetical protein